ncbi:hypothetical protein A9Y76_11680 [Ralstonia insidiosa]|uniref:Uncharacterized protein n=1 Tax=Ralstonia insidiosa TaxID=190721 RepID=A0A191ZY33_9RALS|nr:hypothetical protein A9Y76_11680 [Ralstonia insidiosa]
MLPVSVIFLLLFRLDFLLFLVILIKIKIKRGESGFIAWIAFIVFLLLANDFIEISINIGMVFHHTDFKNIVTKSTDIGVKFFNKKLDDI